MIVVIVAGSPALDGRYTAVPPDQRVDKEQKVTAHLWEFCTGASELARDGTVPLLVTGDCGFGPEAWALSTAEGKGWNHAIYCASGEILGKGPLGPITEKHWSRSPSPAEKISAMVRMAAKTINEDGYVTAVSYDLLATVPDPGNPLLRALRPIERGRKTLSLSRLLFGLDGQLRNSVTVRR